MTCEKFSPDQFLPGDTVLSVGGIKGTVTRVELMVDDLMGDSFKVWGYYHSNVEQYLRESSIRGHIPCIKPYDPTQGNEPDDV